MQIELGFGFVMSAGLGFRLGFGFRALLRLGFRLGFGFCSDARETLQRAKQSISQNANNSLSAVYAKWLRSMNAHNLCIDHTGFAMRTAHNIVQN